MRKLVRIATALAYIALLPFIAVSIVAGFIFGVCSQAFLAAMVDSRL